MGQISELVIVPHHTVQDKWGAADSCDSCESNTFVSQDKKSQSLSTHPTQFHPVTINKVTN